MQLFFLTYGRCAIRCLTWSEVYHLGAHIPHHYEELNLNFSFNSLKLTSPLPNVCFLGLQCDELSIFQQLVSDSRDYFVFSLEEKVHASFYKENISAATVTMQLRLLMMYTIANMIHTVIWNLLSTVKEMWTFLCNQ